MCLTAQFTTMHQVMHKLNYECMVKDQLTRQIKCCQIDGEVCIQRALEVDEFWPVLLVCHGIPLLVPILFQRLFFHAAT